MASNTDPQAVKIHATTLFRPYGASEAGRRNTPEPMVLPTTNATHVQKPSKCGRLAFCISDLKIAGR